MKSSTFVILGTIIFIFLGLFNHEKINEFSYAYIDDFNAIEISIKNDNWSQASELLLNRKIELEKEKDTWYKLINHGYFNEIFTSIEILNQSIYLKNKMVSLQELSKIKTIFHNLIEDECYDFNRIF